MAKSTSLARPLKTRIQIANNEKILKGALETFANHGYRGSTLDQIAEAASMSKPNLLYYYKSKEDIYSIILEETLNKWLIPLSKFNPDGDPFDEIKGYLIRKLTMSQKDPLRSKLFAHEIMQGAKNIMPVLGGALKEQFDNTVSILQHWIDQGKLKAVDPKHLIFMMWATTQHYADFQSQIDVLLDNPDPEQIFNDAQKTLLSVFLDGLRV